MDEQTPPAAPDAPAKKPIREFTERRKTQQRVRRVLALVENAPKVVAQRKCTAKNQAGKPCGKYAIKGGSVCPTHGGSAPQVKKAAAKRLLAMVEPALVELQELVIQNGHLPTKLGAIRTVLERAGDEAIGALKKQAEEKDTRPIINIGIKVGGIAQPTVLVGMQAKQLPAGEEAVDGEVVDDDSGTDE
jgi:hypothetical protein